jgi:hypothetical protein
MINQLKESLEFGCYSLSRLIGKLWVPHKNMANKIEATIIAKLDMKMSP